MTRFKTNAVASAAFALAFSAGFAFAAEEQPKPSRETWSFGGISSRPTRKTCASSISEEADGCGSWSCRPGTSDRVTRRRTPHARR